MAALATDFNSGRLGTIPANALMPQVPDPNPIRLERTMPQVIATDSGPLVRLLRDLTHNCEAWASVVLVPDPERNALRCVGAFNLPASWAALPNYLADRTMNARAYLENMEVVEEGFEHYLPPGNARVTPHLMTAAAVSPIPGVGTVEVIADTRGYHFTDERLRHLRETAAAIASLNWR